MNEMVSRAHATQIAVHVATTCDVWRLAGDDLLRISVGGLTIIAPPAVAKLRSRREHRGRRFERQGRTSHVGDAGQPH